MIGCGAHAAEAHATPLKDYAARMPEKLSLVAACDLRLEAAQAFCRQYGFAAAYSDLDQMLAEAKPDGAWCIVPPAFIVATSIKLLELGIPTVIEKPLGTSIEQARQLVAVADRTGTPHMVSVNRRFVPRLNQAITWAAGRGPLQYLRISMLRNRRVEKSFLSETGIHAIDAARHIAGDVAIASIMPMHREPLAGCWQMIDLLFASGARGRIDVLTTTGSQAENYELFGEGFRVDLQTRLPIGNQSSLRCYAGDKLVLEDVAPADESLNIARGEVSELNEFVQSLAEGRRPYPSAGEILPSIELAFDLERQASAR